jgi:hypothetical protein
MSLPAGQSRDRLPTVSVAVVLTKVTIFSQKFIYYMIPPLKKIIEKPVTFVTEPFVGSLVTFVTSNKIFQGCREFDGIIAPIERQSNCIIRSYVSY